MRQLLLKIAGVAFLVTTWTFAAPPPSLEDLRALVADGEYEDAGAGARARLADIDAAGRGESMDAAETIDVLVESRWRNGEAAEGDTRALAARSLAIKERISGPDSAGVAATLHQLAVVDFFSGDYERARGEWERALSIREKVLGPDHLDVG